MMYKTLFYRVGTALLALSMSASVASAQLTSPVTVTGIGGPPAPFTGFLPSLHIWEQDPFTPKIRQDFIMPGTGAALGSTTWGISATITPLTVIDPVRGNTVLSASNSGRNLIITNQNSGFDVKFGTTTAGGTEAERMTIKANGKIGMGTNSPHANADVHIYTANPFTSLFVQSGQVTTPGTFGVSRTVFALGPQGTSNEFWPGIIQAVDDYGNGTSPQFTGKLEFYTNGSGAAQRFNYLQTMVMQNGKVGIGAGVFPQAKLHVHEGAVLAEGTAGGTPVSGGGTRMMWIPAKKGAFRAGNISAMFGNEWDDANIGDYSFAVGEDTKASTPGSVAIGTLSTAGGIGSGSHGSIAIGHLVNSTGIDAIAMGYNSTASGNYAVAIGSGNTSGGTVSFAIGASVVADADYSVALGHHASSNSNSGCFVFGDNSTTSNVNCFSNDQFIVRAAGGTIFWSNSAMSSGVLLASGSGSWLNISDRRVKANIKEENFDVILQKVIDLPVMSWNYKAQDAKIRHIGPMAQDFYAAFGFGESDTTITTLDIDGINMAALKGLAARTETLRSRVQEQGTQLKNVEALQRQVTELQRQNDGLRNDNNELRLRMDRIEQTLRSGNAKGETIPDLSLGNR